MATALIVDAAKSRNDAGAVGVGRALHARAVRSALMDPGALTVGVRHALGAIPLRGVANGSRTTCPRIEVARYDANPPRTERTSFAHQAARAFARCPAGAVAHERRTGPKGDLAGPRARLLPAFGAPIVATGAHASGSVATDADSARRAPTGSASSRAKPAFLAEPRVDEALRIPHRIWIAARG